MSSIPPSSETLVTLVSGPRPHAFSCVSLPLRVGEIEFSASVMPDRAILIPEWVPRPARTAAATFATQFERGHRIVVHELLKCARESIRGSIPPPGPSAILEPPTLNEEKELVFRMMLNGEQLVLHLSMMLTPSQFHTDRDTTCDSSQLFAAYDAVLDYVQEHLNEIETLDFDTTVLRMSLRDWQGYRERMRLV